MINKESVNEIIVITDLTKIISKIVILDNINVSFQKGLIYGIIGSNGSGKTMLLRVISGLILPTTGTVKIDGSQLSIKNRFPQNIGVLIEYPNFLNNLTGYENLNLLRLINNKASNKDIENSLKKVGLDSVDKRTIRKYSLGMKQKLGVAQAIMDNPDILLLDEPTNGLDKESILKINELLLTLKAEGKTIIIASHDDRTLSNICDKFIYLEQGRQG